MGWTLRGRTIGDDPFITGEECAWAWVPQSKRKSYVECTERLRQLMRARVAKRYAEADALRQQFLDEEATVRIEASGEVVVGY